MDLTVSHPGFNMDSNSYKRRRGLFDILRNTGKKDTLKKGGRDKRDITTGQKMTWIAGRHWKPRDRKNFFPTPPDTALLRS